MYRTKQSGSGKSSRRDVLQAGGALALLGAFPFGAANPARADDGQTIVEMLAWDFQPNTINELVAGWEARGLGKVDLAIIPNLGYSAALQTRLRGGAQIDVYYNFGYNSQKFIREGWAASLNGLPDVDALMADMYESARERHVNAAGDIISVPYFSAVYMLQYNERMLSRAGIESPPQTLWQIYEASKALRSAGIVEAPYRAYWVKEFCEEYLITYLLNEGITPFDAEGAPVFADDPKTRDVFEWWQAMYREELAPKSLLNDDPSKMSTEMAQGDAALFVFHHYFLTKVRDSAGPETGHVRQSPIGGDNHTLQIGEVLQMGEIESDRTRAAAWDLMKYYGWRDENRKFAVFTQWARAAGLAAPYPDFFTDPDVVAVFPDYYDLPLIAETFKTGSKVVPARTLPWYPTFQLRVGDLVHAMLLGQSTPAQAVGDLADAAVAALRNRTL